LIPDIYPPLRAVKTLKPVGIKILSDVKTVYDFGENIPGFLRVIVHGKRGEKITLIHAERCHEDGTLDEKSNNRDLCEDEYILRGDELEVYEPKFTWHGYQFACVTVSSPDVKLVSVESKLVCSDVETVGSFRCDNPIINDLHTKFVRTQRNCLIGVPIDCHQRDERLAWLGDAHVSAQTAIYNFRMDAIYKNWLYDMRLAQNTNNGDIPYIVPRPSKESGTIDWSIAVCLIPLYCYEFYGDVSFSRILMIRWSAISTIFFHFPRTIFYPPPNMGIGPHRLPSTNGETPPVSPPSISIGLPKILNIWPGFSKKNPTE
jgi:alpha-L-rhamnosidase